MKRLLASVAIIGILSGTPARADLPVIDVTSIGHMLEQIGIEGDQLTQLVATVNEVTQVYQMSTNIWNAVEEVVGAGSWAPGLRAPDLLNPLPYAADDHPGWVGGFNDPGGVPYGSIYQTQNTVGGDASIFDDGTFAGQELLKSIRSYSSIMGVANAHLFSIERRISALNELFNQLDALTKMIEHGALTSRLNTELNYANSQQSQATQVMSAITMQHAVFENNQRQWTYLDETNAIAASCGSVGAAGGSVLFMACTGQQ